MEKEARAVVGGSSSFRKHINPPYILYLLHLLVSTLPLQSPHPTQPPNSVTILRW